jgi:hypothetical protein
MDGDVEHVALPMNESANRRDANATFGPEVTQELRPRLAGLDSGGCSPAGLLPVKMLFKGAAGSGLGVPTIELPEWIGVRRRTCRFLRWHGGSAVAGILLEEIAVKPDVAGAPSWGPPLTVWVGCREAELCPAALSSRIASSDTLCAQDNH